MLRGGETGMSPMARLGEWHRRRTYRQVSKTLVAMGLAEVHPEDADQPWEARRLKLTRLGRVEYHEIERVLARHSVMLDRMLRP